MKKFLCIILLYCKCMYADASDVTIPCFCLPDIKLGFNTITNYIIDDFVKPQNDKVKSFNNTIKTNTKRLQEETQEIKKLVAIEKQKALQYERMLFLLAQKREMLK